jgi:hypothetical protein
VDIYVAYRTPFPDEETVKRMKEDLKKNNIEYSQLVEFSIENCEYGDSSTEEESSA